MFGRRKRMPDGSERVETEKAQMDLLEQHFQQEVSWAWGYIQLLERHLTQLKDRCKECPYRNQEGSGCHDEISD